MKRLLILFASFILCLSLGQSIRATAAVKVHRQHSSAFIYHRTHTVNDTKVHFVNAPRRYVHMKTSKKTNRVRSITGTKMAFKTRLLLPYPGKNKQHWGNPQNITISKDNMMYIVYCPIVLRNRGRIVRFDLNRLEQLGVYKNPKRLESVFVKHHGKYSSHQKALQKAIKIGRLFDTGHGQTLAYNPKDQGLYMWRDNRKGNGGPIGNQGYIQHISAKTLRPDRAISFHMNGHDASVYGGTQTFDQDGNVYFWSLEGPRAVIYKGRITQHSVKFRRTNQILKKAPGTFAQSMGYNPKRGRLYLVSDDSIASFPAKQLNGHGSLTRHSFEWSELTPRREIEGLTFDNAGTAYLLANHNPEVLRSTAGF